MQIEQAKIQHRDKLVEALYAAEHNLKAQIDVYNKAIEEAYSTLESRSTEYNALLTEAKELIEDVVSEIDAEIVATADKEQGEKLCELRDQWDMSFDDHYLDDPDYATNPDESAAALLEATPEGT
jgi:sugar-specific transcriptional regulator TrmB